LVFGPSTSGGSRTRTSCKIVSRTFVLASFRGSGRQWSHAGARSAILPFGKEPVMISQAQILIIAQESGEKDNLENIFVCPGVPPERQHEGLATRLSRE